MSKMPTLLETLPGPATRSWRGSSPRADCGQSHKRPFLDDTDEAQNHIASPRVYKKARVDESPNERCAQSPSPSPWPIIDDEIADDDSSKPTLQEWQKDVHEAINRSEAALRFARREYTKFRNNRLPSPAPSDEEPAVDDPDTDEFGCCPSMLNLENDDPEVEEVFGAAYAQRIRGRSRPHAPAIKPQRVFSPPPKEQPERDNFRNEKLVDRRGDQSPLDPRVPRPPRRKAQGSQDSTRLPKAQTSDRNIRPPTRGSQRSQLSINIHKRDMTDKCNTQSLGQRFTRRSRGQVFYELDYCGKPRVVRVN